MVTSPRWQFLASLPLSLLVACGAADSGKVAPTSAGASATPSPAPSPTPSPTPSPAASPAAANTPAPTAGGLDAAIAKLMQQPERADESITVQHVLIAFQGAPRITGVTRSKDEAKALAEQVWQQAIGGADFKALMKQHSNDSGGGEYPMTKAGRAQMVAGFGDVGFRLAPGEIGVAPWHATASPYGWHVIKRVK